MNQFHTYKSAIQQDSEHPEFSVSQTANNYGTGGISVTDSTEFTPTYPYSSLHSNHGTSNFSMAVNAAHSIASTKATTSLVLPSIGDPNSRPMYELDTYFQHQQQPQQQQQQQYQSQQQIHSHTQIGQHINVYQFHKLNSPRNFDFASNHSQDANFVTNYNANNHYTPTYTEQFKLISQQPLPKLHSTNYHNASLASTASVDSIFDDKSQATSIDGHNTSYSSSSTHSSTPMSSISSASYIPEYESLDITGGMEQSDYTSGKVYTKPRVELPSIGCINNNNNAIYYNSSMYSNASYEAVGLPYDCLASVPNREQYINFENINKENMAHNNLTYFSYCNVERKANIVNGINEKFELLNIKKGKGGRKAIPLDGVTVLKVALGGEMKRSSETTSGGKKFPETNSRFDVHDDDTHQYGTHDDTCDETRDQDRSNSEINRNDRVTPESFGYGKEIRQSSVSDPNKSYKCSVCSKSYTRNHNLVSHERTHRDLKPFKCSTCDKLFTRHHDLKRHESLHLKVKKFICRGILSDNETKWGCGRTFARKDSLLKHLQTKKAKSKCIEKLIKEENRNKH
ncbi:unnamed protein product [[Candida] boidinii]|uniref:Unnamed protein product n=1 Tax=Candida boidinii TaxID=5477 RepID=A0A9W6T084_CANBO|nr:hypothetical protein B5S33_g3651 [[Candida] boidinii]GME69918.1 unnamed protein product [[Candida] boidinii]